jgi:hypothetical protein
MIIETIAVTDAITTIHEAHQMFALQPTEDASFFSEWQLSLPELSEVEKHGLDRLRDRYLYYAADGFISEGTVNTVMISPLLELLGFFDLPFKVRSEAFVRLTIPIDDENEKILRGRIDSLIIQNQLWVIVVEAKHFGFSVLQALPQTLAYMMANPEPTNPCFGMITTGEDYLFVKVDRSQSQATQTPLNTYGKSYKFTLLSDETNNLHRVARVLKRLGGRID